MARLDDAIGSVVVRQRLDAHPSSVSRARRLVARALGDLGQEEYADDAALAVSELVTNALVHAGTSIEVVVSQRDAEVVVEVVDDNPRLPFRRHHAELAGTGRGLHLVEQLTTAWGTRERPPGKSVWFQVGGQARRDDPPPRADPADLGPGTDFETDLDLLLAAFPDDAGEPARSGQLDSEVPVGDQEADEEEPPVLEVVLLQVPLLLHAAWQLQAESVLREYLLTRLGDTGLGESDESEHDAEVEVELGEHAAVHEALVLLQEHLPAPELGDHAEKLMSSAVEPHVTAERLVVPLPTASLDSFVRMEAILDVAMRMAEAGALLTPPTQPEVRQFRRWVCREVREQRAGRAPRPWRLDFGPELEPEPTPPSWDPSEVDTAVEALIAAADTNRMVAVSPAAARLLGYASRDELVGRRLVDIIPARFRQAHLAGFTLHLFAGRSPLLGHPVQVPALRRDGSEVDVTLLVEEVSLTGGRRVYRAEITEAGSPR